MSITKVPDPNWYTDTGATAGMKIDPSSLASLSSYIVKDKIYFGDGAGLNITHTGSNKFSSSPLNYTWMMC